MVLFHKTEEPVARGIWHRHYYPLMYLWSGASGAVTGLTESGEFAGISKDDFEPVSAFFLGLAFPKGSTEDYMKLVGLTEIPLFQYYVDFGVLNPDSNSDDPRQLETERFCMEQEAANPNLFRRVKLFALIIFKQVVLPGRG